MTDDEAPRPEDDEPRRGKADGKAERQREAEALLAQGEPRSAAMLFELAGLSLEAARAFRAAGDGTAALAVLVRVSLEHASYREACLLAVELLEEQEGLSLAVENFLARFLRTAPLSDNEVRALERLARVYERQGFPENAAEIVRKLAAVRPEYAAEAARLDAVAPPEQELADLPPLPGLPLPPDEGERLTPQQDAAALSGEERPIFHTGALISSRYRLEDRIGAGGMSVVFRARDLEVEDEVAIKVFTQAVFEPEADARMRRELLLARQLFHRNVLRVFDMGVSRGFRYLTMELLTGRSLADRLRAGPVGLDEGLGYLAQACAGLQAAHDLGIVHRDVKPSNLFITTGGLVKVMDFGLAKMRDAPGLTGSGVVAGTAAYMAPEQAGDFRAVSPATDLYALGVVAYEMFTATLPFMHENPLELLLLHRQALPPPPRSRNQSLPVEVERLILRCLEKEPPRRPASCRELGHAFEAVRLR